MTVVITGIGGLLGRELASQARLQGHRVVGLARRPDPELVTVADELVIEDLTAPGGSRKNWRTIAGDAVVYHLAASTQVYRDSDRLHHDSVAATTTACTIAHQTGGRLVFFSSAAVYSGADTQFPVTPLHENSPCFPDTTYGRAKKKAEEVVARSGLSAIILRLFGILSAQVLVRPPRGNLIQAIAESVSSGVELKLGVDLQGRPAVRDYMLAEDACHFALLSGELLTSGAAISHKATTLNLGTGRPTTTYNIAQAAQHAFGTTFPVVFEKRRSCENHVMLSDVSALKQLIGRTPVPRVNEFWHRMDAAKLIAGRRQISNASKSR